MARDAPLRLLAQEDDTDLRPLEPEAGGELDDPEYAVRLLDHGAAGRAYLLKERLSEAGQLTSAIKQVAAGDLR